MANRGTPSASLPSTLELSRALVAAVPQRAATVEKNALVHVRESVRNQLCRHHHTEIR